MSNEHEKYIRLLRIRMNLLLTPVYIMAIFLICAIFLHIFGVSDDKPLLAVVLIGFILFYFSMFRFLANDICPWCKKQFFGNGLLFTRIFFSKKCIHCGRPHDS